jgi:Methyltransferase domain
VTTWRGEAHQSRLQKLMRLLRSFTANPVVVVRSLPGEFRQRYGSEVYRKDEIDEDWYEHLHDLLGAPWPCPEVQHIDELMAEISDLLTGKGLGFGRNTYGWYADGEGSLCRAVWCAALHTRPEVVIETGVAHGVTSRIVLEALSRNDRGHLWSIDLPHPLDHRLHAETGVAVTEDCRQRWTYLEGASKDRLPPLVPEVGRVDMFVHDSLHTAKNTLFEMEQAASMMRPGGVMLVDDIKSHVGFATFAKRHAEYRTIVCETEDNIGMFGIAVNGPAHWADPEKAEAQTPDARRQPGGFA